MNNTEKKSAPAGAVDGSSTKLPLATGHENESLLEHQGSINYKANDGFGNASDKDRVAAPKGQYETEKKIPPAV